MKRLILTLLTLLFPIFCLAAPRNVTDLRVSIIEQNKTAQYCNDSRLLNGCIHFPTRDIYIVHKDNFTMQFTLFHEIGHYLLYHDVPKGDTYKEELEADKFSEYMMCKKYLNVDVIINLFFTKEEINKFNKAFNKATK